MEAQRLETGTEVESAGSAVQEVGGKCDRRGKSEIRKVNKNRMPELASDFYLSCEA